MNQIKRILNSDLLWQVLFGVVCAVSIIGTFLSE